MTTATSNALPAHRRHDLSDQTWLLLEPLLPGRRGVWGGVARDTRLFLNAVCWILRTGAPWRDRPSAYGDWKNTHRRFCRWRPGWQSGHGHDNRGLNSTLHLAVDAHGMAVRLRLTAGPTADCTQAGVLIDGLSAEHLLADRGDDSDAIVEHATNQGIQVVIPPRKNRTVSRP